MESGTRQSAGSCRFNKVEPTGFSFQLNDKVDNCQKSESDSVTKENPCWRGLILRNNEEVTHDETGNHQ